MEFGRKEEFDSRSRKFPIRTVTKPTAKKFRAWKCTRWLDQGNEGACVGFGIAHELIGRPAQVKGINANYARRKIYWEAQKIDPWNGGAYPGASPSYEGTSVLAGVKVAHKLGWFENYRWAFKFDELVNGVLQKGPAVLGLPWMQGMRSTKKKYIRANGRVIGGHCILCNSVNLEKKRFNLHNSWGRDWGNKGDAYISFSDMRKLLNMNGEAVFFIGRKSTPTVNLD